MSADLSENIARYKAQGKSAFIVGYTGEVGKCVVKILNEYKIFRRVVLIGRREVPLDAGAEFEQKVVNFDKLDEHQEVFQGLDVGFACLGSMITQHGEEMFLRVDRDYMLATAEAAKAGGCQHFSIVSASGAKASSVFLYNRIKGYVDETLQHMRFERLSIYRPGLLLAKRESSGWCERLTRCLFTPFLCCDCFVRRSAVHVSLVAKAMVNNVVTPAKSAQVEIYDNPTIHRMADN